MTTSTAMIMITTISSMSVNPSDWRKRGSKTSSIDSG
jgi:hypothetical protein